MRPLRIAIMDDHGLVRAGLRALLASLREVEVVAEVPDGAALLEVLEEKPADLVLFDLHVPGQDGIASIERLKQRHPGLRIVVVSMDDAPAAARAAAAAGAEGYLAKQAAVGELEAAVRTVAAGGRYLTASITRAMLDGAGDDPAQLLTQRQLHILTFVAQGLTSREIAGKLDVSARTVDLHRTRIMERLQLRDVAALTRYAMKHRLVR